ncbi:MAG TPA: sigma-54 dependent transcriptional regulator [Bryobacteraceae bacterium]|nr:sigma-54 dependent transcriptional regulator [Bryobacteraceae bacterium]
MTPLQDNHTSKGSILVIDDEPASLRVLLAILTEQGYEVHPANEGELALRYLGHTLPDLVLVDVRMPGMDGYQVCATLKSNPATQAIPVIFISSADHVIDKVRAFRGGAVDYVSKPVDAEEVVARIETHISLRRLRDRLESMVQERTSQLVMANERLERALQELRVLKEQLQLENLVLRDEVDKMAMFGDIVGSSEPLQRVLRHVAKVAPTDSTVLITGESGTGKELVARAIHKSSQRYGRPFIRVNCAAIPQSLIASELFGHEKGAFTGAMQRRLGRFEMATRGTIFLDEVGEIPPETQIALLRVLQERELERVGGSQTVPVDVRVLAATNRDLKASVAAGTFRLDLFYRLNVFPVHMPSLRERVEDIPLLIEYFIEQFANKTGRKIRNIQKRTLDLLSRYHWPGNIRELQNVIERAVILCEGETFAVDETWFQKEKPGMQDAPVALTEMLVDRKREAIEAALIQSKGRVSGPTGAAAALGIPRQTLESTIRSLGINKHRFRD